MSKAADPIDCREAELLIHFRVDQEIDPADGADLDAHLQQCDACAQSLALLEKTRAHLHAKENATELPPGLEAKIRARTVDADISDVAPLQPIAASASSPAPPRRPYFAAALAGGVFVVLAIAAAVGLGFGLGERTRDESSAVALVPTNAAPQDAVAASVANHSLDVPVDVASPDPKVVEAFLKPRIGRPVHVPRLDREGFGLRGGRVVAVQHQRAAQLVYDGGLGKRMTVVVVPDHSAAPSRGLKQRGSANAVVEVHRGNKRGYAVRTLRHHRYLYTVVDTDGKGAVALSNALSNPPTFAPVDAVTGAK